MTRAFLTLATCSLLAGCATSAVDERTTPDAPPRVRLNEIQVVGSHNSYKEAIAPSLLQLLARRDPGMAQALDYAHVPLAEQLDLGLRNLELDVLYDPEGGRYASPYGPELVRQHGLPAGPAYDPEGRMHTPGFKVLHMPDVDYRSNCLLLRDCLAEIAAWSDAHPQHLPLVVTVNAKDSGIDEPGFTEPLPFSSEAYDALDAEIVAALGADRLLRPDDVRGTHASLEKAVLAGAWPTLAEARGRVLFVLDETGEKLRAYVEGHPSLRGRAMFATAPPGTPEAAFLILNEPVEQQERIRALVAAGYLVRTRADANTVEARTGDTRRREAAFASGAQVVTTDYYRPDPSFGTDYRVTVPGGGIARCNPVSAGPDCRSDLLE